MSERMGDWMCTASGVQFWPLDPRADEISIEDIAHALSNVCRFGGHCREFYSVAQHCVLVANRAMQLTGNSLPFDPMPAKWGLLHEAAEAYIGDMIRPLKRSMFAFKAAEERILQCVAECFGLPMHMPRAVRQADEDLLTTEAYALMPQKSVERWALSGKRLDVPIVPLPPKDAHTAFMHVYKFLWSMK